MHHSDPLSERKDLVLTVLMEETPQLSASYCFGWRPFPALAASNDWSSQRYESLVLLSLQDSELSIWLEEAFTEMILQLNLSLHPIWRPFPSTLTNKPPATSPHPGVYLLRNPTGNRFLKPAWANPLHEACHRVIGPNTTVLTNNM